jgi:hypothetical protein
MTIDDCRLLICEGKIPTSTSNNRHSPIINLSLSRLGALPRLVALAGLGKDAVRSE